MQSFGAAGSVVGGALGFTIGAPWGLTGPIHWCDSCRCRVSVGGFVGKGRAEGWRARLEPLDDTTDRPRAVKSFDGSIKTKAKFQRDHQDTRTRVAVVPTMMIGLQHKPLIFQLSAERRAIGANSLGRLYRTSWWLLHREVLFIGEQPCYSV